MSSFTYAEICSTISLLVSVFCCASMVFCNIRIAKNIKPDTDWGHLLRQRKFDLAMSILSERGKISGPDDSPTDVYLDALNAAKIVFRDNAEIYVILSQNDALISRDSQAQLYLKLAKFVGVNGDIDVPYIMTRFGPKVQSENV